MQHIVRQKEIISLLSASGLPTDLAEDVLHTFEQTLVEHMRNRTLAKLLNLNWPASTPEPAEQRD